MIGQHLAIANHNGRIENLGAGVFRVAGDERNAAHFFFEALERARHLQAHPGVKQQILGRVTRYREFREHYQIRAVPISCFIGGSHNARRIAVDIAYN